MKEVHISRYSAAKIVKKYYEEYYDNIVNIRVKQKLENNDLIMIVRKQRTCFILKNAKGL